MIPNLQRLLKTLTLGGLFTLSACQSVGSNLANAAGPEGAEYQVTLTSTWTPANHPLEYPEAGLVSGPHFSGLIGATHAGKYVLFQEGNLPTPGLEILSEEGKHDPLNKEIQSAIAAHNAGTLFESGPLRDFAQSAMTQFQVTDQFPMVSVVAMIAPSPDWFTGAMNVNLKENGEWVRSKSVTLYAWDSGGDDGMTYKASDMDNNPKKATSSAKNPHFMVNGKAIPVGTLTFTRLQAYP